MSICQIDGAAEDVVASADFLLILLELQLGSVLRCFEDGVGFPIFFGESFLCFALRRDEFRLSALERLCEIVFGDVVAGVVNGLRTGDGGIVLALGGIALELELHDGGLPGIAEFALNTGRGCFELRAHLPLGLVAF